MSAVDNVNRDPLAGLTLDEILAAGKRAASAMSPSPTPAPAPPPQVSRTLLDIIREEEPRGGLFGHKDKKSWKAFTERLRLKRAGAAWTSSVPIPASDIPIHDITNLNSVRFNNSRSLMSRRNSVRFTTVSSLTPSEDDSSASAPTSRPVMTRGISTRHSAPPPDSPQSEEADIHAVVDVPPVRSFKPQMSRHNSTRIPATSVEVMEEPEGEPAAQEGTRRLATVLAEERAMSAREAVATQEAAEAEAAAQEAEEETSEEEEEEEEAEGAAGVRMSLMDLLEETDRQMGVVGSRYAMPEEEEEEEEKEMEEEEGGKVEQTCCVCRVRHKGAAFIPCGHTFCRLCSRELWVQRGNCPLCNGFILEILDIF